MKQVCFLSGKGGTGKTTLCAAFGTIEGRAVLVDADVESSNLPLLVKHEILHNEPFTGRKCAVINGAACTACRRCLDLCAYGALIEKEPGVPAVIDSLCEGCGLCARLCPAGVITMKELPGGEWHVSRSAAGPLVHASLALSEEASGKLIRVLRVMAESLAIEGEYPVILIDGPAGLGCPAMSAITGVDAVIAVTEPTAAGLSDLERMLDLTGHFGIPTCLCINKSTIDGMVKRQIEQRCKERGIFLAGHVPYDDAFREALNRGLTITEHGNGVLNETLTALWKDIRRFVDRSEPCPSHS
jgi:MinD superfamily P-loop ATPase